MMISKVQGNIVDTLMPPLNAHELPFVLSMGGMTRGVVVCFAVGLVVAVFVPLCIHNLGLVVFHAVGASLMLSLLGVAGGIWSDKFGHIAAVPNFLVPPLSFLSGTFYSIHRLPETAQIIAQLNPFFYMIDGFRYGFIGQAGASIWVGMVVVAGVDAVLWWVCWRMFETGYKLKP